jgi:hypothetical protein
MQRRPVLELVPAVFQILDTEIREAVTGLADSISEGDLSPDSYSEIVRVLGD